MDVGRLTAAAFAARLHEVFRIRLDPDRSLELQLVEVSEPPARAVPADGLRSPFSIVFRGPPGPALPQRTYRLEHEGMGALELFLVPIAPDAAGSRYEAVVG